jgi:metallo-beta-lactamase class B
VGTIAFLTMSGPAIAAEPIACAACAEWNLPQEPFRIHGRTYYVGTKGLGSILITSNDGHVLIDGGLPESASLVAANIETLGFRIEDVALILNSHAHYDHAGGIAELQRLSGARVAASPWSAEALRLGTPPLGDPQYGLGVQVEPIGDIDIIEEGDQLRVGDITMNAHFTPGHTPGGTSWSWRSCEGGECLDIVYADSLTPVSADDFYFTRGSDYPGAVGDFEMSFTRLENLPCDILLAPHPGFTDLFDALERRQSDEDSTVLIDPDACYKYVGGMRDWLARRVAEENAEPQ